MEAGEYGLTLGTCFIACRLELDTVAGLLWISWCVLGGADFFRIFLFFSSNVHGLLQVSGHLALFTSLLVGMGTCIVTCGNKTTGRQQEHTVFNTYYTPMVNILSSPTS